MNIVCDALIVYVTVNILARYGMILAGVICSLLFALSPILARICVGGMEMNLYLLLSICAVVLFHYQRKDCDPRGDKLLFSQAGVDYSGLRHVRLRMATQRVEIGGHS